MTDASTDRKHLIDKGNYTKAKRQFYRIWALIGVLALIALAGRVVGVLSGPVAIVVWSAVIVVIFGGLVDWLESKKIPRWIGVVASYLILFLVLFILIVVIFSPVGGMGNQFVSFMEDLPHWAESFTAYLSSVYNHIGGMVDSNVIENWIDTASSSLVTWANSLAKNSATGIVNASASIL
ncbi:MAG: AI-2E family transporter, partial [Eggerthellaceae bacterium]|nr:AI-2E family transporter [Eggerthellaceae bacterium]